MSAEPLDAIVKEEQRVKTLGNIIGKIAGVIDRVEEAILCVLLAETVIVGFLQIFFRFVLRAPLPWSEELLRMSFIWVTFIGAGLGMSRHSHVSVDFFSSLLPVGFQRWLKVISDIIILAFIVFLSHLSILFVGMAAEFGTISAAMEVPMAIPYSGFIIAFSGMIFQILYKLINSVCQAISG